MLNPTNTISDSSFLAFAQDPTISTICKAQTSSTRVIADGNFDAWRIWDATRKSMVDTNVMPDRSAKTKPDGTAGKLPPYKFTIRLQKLNEVKNESGQLKDADDVPQTDPETGLPLYYIMARIAYAGEKYDKREKTLTTVPMPPGVPTAKECLAYWRERLLSGKSVPETVEKAIRLVMTESGEFKTHVPYHVKPGDRVEASIFAYSDDARAAITATRDNGMPAIQAQTPVRLEGLSAELRLEPYVKPAQEASSTTSAAAYAAIMADEGAIVQATLTVTEVDSDAQNPLFGWIISAPMNRFDFSTGKLSAKSSDKTLSEQLHENYNKFERPGWVPYGMLASGRFKFQYNQKFYFYVAPQYQSPDGSFMRCSLTTNLSLADFEYKDKDGVKTQKYKWSLADGIRVQDKQEKYIVNITGGNSKIHESPLAAWGIPDVAISGRIFLATAGFPCHVIANLGMKKMRENDYNAQKSDEQRAAQGGPLGIYEFYAQTIAPDFTAGLPMFGIPLSKERVIAEFAEPAKLIKEKKNRFYIEHIDHEDHTKTTVFRNFFPKIKNPVNAQGSDAAVINFGCGECPTLECGDATEMLEHMRFYALTSKHDLMQALVVIAGDTAKGDALFDQFKAEPGAKDPSSGFAYQIFGLRIRAPSAPEGADGAPEAEADAVGEPEESVTVAEKKTEHPVEAADAVAAPKSKRAKK